MDNKKNLSPDEINKALKVLRAKEYNQDQFKRAQEKETLKVKVEAMKKTYELAIAEKEKPAEIKDQLAEIITHLKSTQQTKELSGEKKELAEKMATNMSKISEANTDEELLLLLESFYKYLEEKPKEDKFSGIRLYVPLEKTKGFVKFVICQDRASNDANALGANLVPKLQLIPEDKLKNNPEFIRMSKKFGKAWEEYDDVQFLVRDLEDKELAYVPESSIKKEPKRYQKITTEEYVKQLRKDLGKYFDLAVLYQKQPEIFENVMGLLRGKETEEKVNAERKIIEKLSEQFVFEGNLDLSVFLKAFFEELYGKLYTVKLKEKLGSWYSWLMLYKGDTKGFESELNKIEDKKQKEEIRKVVKDLSDQIYPEK